MLSKQLEIRMLGEPPVPFCFKMSRISTQNDMSSCHIELPAQLKPIKASGMPTVPPPLLLSRSMSGSAVNAGRHYVVNGKRRVQHHCMRPWGAPGRLTDTGCEGQRWSREDPLLRLVERFVASILIFEYSSTANCPRAHPTARIQAAFREGISLTLPRIGLGRPFRTLRP
jgi:hypothetical protein